MGYICGWTALSFKAIDRCLLVFVLHQRCVSVRAFLPLYYYCDVDGVASPKILSTFYHSMVP